jgi:hypothetical protein
MEIEMRGKVAKVLRRECNERGVNYRKVKKKYARLRPVKDLEGNWISVKDQKRLLCLN